MNQQQWLIIKATLQQAVAHGQALERKHLTQGEQLAARNDIAVRLGADLEKRLSMTDRETGQ